MPLNQQMPVLDGISPSWADVSCKISITGAPLIEMFDFKSISSGRSVDVGEQRGASGGRVMKTTTGAGKNEASATLYYDGYLQLIEGLSLVAPTRAGGDEVAVSLVHFQIQYQFTPFGSTRIYNRLIQGCRLVGDTSAPAEGTDAHTIDVALNPKKIIDILPNGKRVVLL